MTGDTPAGFQCPQCDRPPYLDYWQMLGCVGRDLAAAENPDSPTGRLLAGRPVPRDDAPARRPTIADLSVYALAALLKVSLTIEGLTAVAGQAQAATEESAADRLELHARLAALEAAAAPAPDPEPDPMPTTPTDPPTD